MKVIISCEIRVVTHLEPVLSEVYIFINKGYSKTKSERMPYVCVLGVRSVAFWSNFAYVQNELSPQAND